MHAAHTACYLILAGCLLASSSNLKEEGLQSYNTILNFYWKTKNLISMVTTLRTLISTQKEWVRFMFVNKPVFLYFF
jgi:hypothetical protein